MRQFLDILWSFKMNRFLFLTLISCFMGTISLNAATDVNKISERDLQSGFLEKVIDPRDQEITRNNMKGLLRENWSTASSVFSSENIEKLDDASSWLDRYKSNSKAVFLCFLRLEEITPTMDGKLGVTQIIQIKSIVHGLLFAGMHTNHLANEKFYNIAKNFIKRCIEKRFLTLDELKSFKSEDDSGQKKQILEEIILEYESNPFKEGVDDSVKSQAKNFMSWLQDERWTPLDTAAKFDKLLQASSFLSYYQAWSNEVPLFFERMRGLITREIDASKGIAEVKTCVQGISKNMFKDGIIVFLEDKKIRPIVTGFIKKAGTAGMLTKENLRIFKAAGTSNGELRDEVLGEVESSVPAASPPAPAASPEPKKKSGLLGGLLKKKS